jgi:hypothetical protein
MAGASSTLSTTSRFPLPSLDDQAEMAEQHGLETLLFCPDPWALRHGFVNQETGEMARARCNRWNCLYCGPRKVDQWRQLVKGAAPTLFLTLTKAGKTVEEAARALTTFLQYLRRGSKGKGPNRKGAREAYPIEYFAVLERHSNFEENGFHWHLLVKGVEFIPHEVLKEAWSSARHGEADIVWIEAIRRPQVIGYVTKYLTKSLSSSEKGIRYEEREMTCFGLNDEGRVAEERYITTVEVVSKARRIRYSRHFFPEKVADLRARLLAEFEQEAMEQTEGEAATGSALADETGQEDNGKLVEDGPLVVRSPWSLVEQAPFTQDIKEYRLRRRKVLLERLIDLRAGQCHLSRRVISMWAYQRSESR